MNTRFIHTHFSQSFNWSFAGSLVYELAKTVHQAALFLFLSTNSYGVIGTTLSLIYCASRFADAGATNSLAPLYTALTANKKLFKRIVVRHFLLPLLPACGGVLCLALLASYKLDLIHHFGYSAWFFIPSLIILETLRGIMRAFLHCAMQSRRVVLLELASYGCYLTYIWVALLYFTPTPAMFLTIHLLDSSFIVAVFLLLSFRVYQNLPHRECPKEVLELSRRRINTIKSTTYLLRLTKDIFSHNFLTTILSFWIGAEYLGPFYFASSAFYSVQSIIKSCITYPGSAFLAHLKQSSLGIKREAFSHMAYKLLLVLIPGLTLCMTHYQFFFSHYQTTQHKEYTLLLFALSLVLLMTDLLFLLYEQFYLVEESALRLSMLKCSEFAVLFFIIASSNTPSLGILIMYIFIAKASTTALIIFDAYAKWKISIPLKNMTLYAAAWLLVAIIISKLDLLHFVFFNKT